MLGVPLVIIHVSQAILLVRRLKQTSTLFFLLPQLIDAKSTLCWRSPKSLINQMVILTLPFAIDMVLIFLSSQEINYS